MRILERLPLPCLRRALLDAQAQRDAASGSISAARRSTSWVRSRLDQGGPARGPLQGHPAGGPQQRRRNARPQGDLRQRRSRRHSSAVEYPRRLEDAAARSKRRRTRHPADRHGVSDAPKLPRPGHGLRRRPRLDLRSWPAVEQRAAMAALFFSPQPRPTGCACLARFICSLSPATGWIADHANDTQQRRPLHKSQELSASDCFSLCFPLPHSRRAQPRLRHRRNAPKRARRSAPPAPPTSRSSAPVSSEPKALCAPAWSSTRRASQMSAIRHARNAPRSGQKRRAEADYLCANRGGASAPVFLHLLFQNNDCTNLLSCSQAPLKGILAIPPAQKSV